ncbi:WD_REPEATS_REGION domain-containing protein [Psidium guajava]|nr:WD_REPEATS_REGION domain-containing protein [Psidium guajava]
MPAKRQIENPIKDEQIVRISATYQRRGVNQFDPDYVSYPDSDSTMTHMAGTGEDVEDLGVVAKEAQIADRVKEGPIGEDLVVEGVGGLEALVLLVEGEELATGEVAGGSGEAMVGGGGGGRRGGCGER